MGDNNLPGSPADQVVHEELLLRALEPWKTELLGRCNTQCVKLMTLQGAYPWHHHIYEDELFLCLAGGFIMEFRDRPTVTVGPGELLIVPRGVVHRPIAEDSARVLLVEPHTNSKVFEEGA